jgi:hypothetical protein
MQALAPLRYVELVSKQPSGSLAAEIRTVAPVLK